MTRFFKSHSWKRDLIKFRRRLLLILAFSSAIPTSSCLAESRTNSSKVIQRSPSARNHELKSTFIVSKLLRLALRAKLTMVTETLSSHSYSLEWRNNKSRITRNGGAEKAATTASSEPTSREKAVLMLEVLTVSSWKISLKNSVQVFFPFLFQRRIRDMNMEACVSVSYWTMRQILSLNWSRFTTLGLLLDLQFAPCNPGISLCIHPSGKRLWVCR